MLLSLALTVLTLPHIYKADQTDNTCTVIPLGHGRDDVPNILAAVQDCGRIPGGRILLPEPYTYRINQRLTTHLEHSTLAIHGTLLFSDDLTYWVNNSYRVDFQNQSSAWRITGHDYEVNGGPSMGGIDGNGQLWYTWAKGGSNVFGRPIPMHIYNSTRAVVRNFAIRQPQFWAVLVDESSHVLLKNFYVNATNSDSHATEDTVWIQNTDGVDTFRSDHVVIKDWVYEGGDDAVAFKGNSTNVVVQNMTVYGGPGIAFGSLGQYPDRADIVENITVKDVTFQPSFQRAINSGVYFKSWSIYPLHSEGQKLMHHRIGVNFGNPPNGGGGGHGYLRNVTVENIQFKDVQMPIYFDTCLSYLFDEDVTQYCDTSTYRFEDVHFKNIQGNGLATPTDYPGENITFAVSVICSKKARCRDITFQDVDISLPDQYEGKSVLCQNADVDGLECNV